MITYLFAYGFLKTRFHGSRKTETPEIKAELITNGFYPGKMFRVNVYPGVVYDPECGQKVKGEIFKLENAEEMLHVLDRYENALPLVLLDPDYERRMRTIETPSGPLDCWVYEYLKAVNPATEIKSGEF